MRCLVCGCRIRSANHENGTAHKNKVKSKAAEALRARLAKERAIQEAEAKAKSTAS